MSSTPESCLYDGWVRHRRFMGVEHELRTHYFTAYLDLDELPELFDHSRLWSARGRAIAAFRREDHLGDPTRSLADEVRRLVAARSGSAPAGPIRLLTNLRYFGHCFNPVSFYYCFAPDGERVEAVVAEVTNTPWGERHAYVLEPAAERPPGAVLRGRFAKEFHVSPFMGMDHTYSWSMTEPGEQLVVHIESAFTGTPGDSGSCVAKDKPSVPAGLPACLSFGTEGPSERRVLRNEGPARNGGSFETEGRRTAEPAGQLAFDATLSLRRRELSPATMRRLLARHPMITLRSQRQIYTHGLALKLKGARYFPNPSGAPLIGRSRRRHAQRSRETAVASADRAAPGVGAGGGA